ncbi:DUF3800 domain-containing protein [Priestia megaterium]|uniref:DUF3800 domain-containing protein n=1 Tax=Priestia megaterium TaxID=1404 RepID=UPI0025B0984C|nr:DUF3800 domain-containing protein [Priestia megaterium]MDN3365428.1 DUF3800 domain-containing protein [Priestia megaterium]
MEYLIYCDESSNRGKLFSNFYGGALVRSTHLKEIEERLEEFKAENNMNGEVKWTKVTAPYLEKYIGLMDVFFDLLVEDKIKMRVMFQQNAVSDKITRTFSKEEHAETYFKLYYQFIKHIFGLRYSNQTEEEIYVRLFFDQFPDKKEKIDNFKGFIHKLQYSQEFQDANLSIRYNDIVEVTSHDHIILQCADIITGAMFFRLNKLHLEKDPVTNRRGKRTIAKEKLYKHIHKRICETRANFNIGASTGIDHDVFNRWKSPYRHWLFTPSEISSDFKKILN